MHDSIEYITLHWMKLSCFVHAIWLIIMRHLNVNQLKYQKMLIHHASHYQKTSWYNQSKKVNENPYELSSMWLSNQSYIIMAI